MRTKSPSYRLSLTIIRIMCWIVTFPRAPFKKQPLSFLSIYIAKIFSLKRIGYIYFSPVHLRKWARIEIDSCEDKMEIVPSFCHDCSPGLKTVCTPCELSFSTTKCVYNSECGPQIIIKSAVAEKLKSNFFVLPHYSCS